MIFDKDRPIYIQIKREIKERIVRGDIEKKLPTVRELAREVGVNPNTVARAYRELEREGVVDSRVGRGTWVKKEATEEIKRKIIYNTVMDFRKKMESLGFDKEKIVKIMKDVYDSGS